MDFCGWEVPLCLSCPQTQREKVVIVICLQVCPFFQEDLQIQYRKQKETHVYKADKLCKTSENLLMEKKS